MMIADFWVVTPCGLVRGNQSFGQPANLQGVTTHKTRRKTKFHRAQTGTLMTTGIMMVKIMMTMKLAQNHWTLQEEILWPKRDFYLKYRAIF
jgi:hypothetical protein